MGIRVHQYRSSMLMMNGTADILNVQGAFTNAGSVTVGSLETLNANGGFTNSGGNVTVSSGGALNTSNYSQSSGLTDVSGNLTSHSYSQTGGNTTVETGGVLSATTFTATGGSVTVNGTLDPTAVEIGPSAFLQGKGTIFGNVAMGGTIMPGAPGTPGTLTIFGDYEQIGTGTLDELVGPLSHSFLNVSGDVTLDSDSFLNIILLNGYNPLGQTLDIMDYNSLAGEGCTDFEFTVYYIGINGPGSTAPKSFNVFSWSTVGAYDEPPLIRDGLDAG